MLHGRKLDEVLLLKPNAEAPREKKAPQADGPTHPLIRRYSNSRLHVALGMALVVSSLIALAIPITRTHADQMSGDRRSLSTAGEELSAAIQQQAERVSEMLASTNVVPSAQVDVRPAASRSTSARQMVPDRLLATAARVVAGSAFDSPEVQTALAVGRQYPAQFTVHEEGYASSHISTQVTVGQALAGLGITVDPHDRVTPSAGSRLVPGAHVYIQHAVKTRLVLAGVEQEVFTHADTVGGMLAEAGVWLETMDRVSPIPATAVRRDMRVSVTTVRDATETSEEVIPFDTVYRYDSDVAEGRELLEQAGGNGSIHREYRIRLINGKEVQRELVNEIVTPASDEVVTVGTYVRPSPTATPTPVVTPVGELTCRGSLSVYATWYTAASAGGSGTTATGTAVYKGIVAVDPTVIPLGTQLYIPGYGYGVAADTGGGIKGYMIDLGYGPNDVYDWRTRWVDICIL